MIIYIRFLIVSLLSGLGLFFSNPIFGQIDFLPAITIPTGSDPSTVAINDVNNDGLDDVIFGTGFYFDTNDYKIWVFLQNDQGELNDPVRYPYPENSHGLEGMTVDDVNNDGYNDVIIAYESSVGVFYQNDTGGLHPMIAYDVSLSAYSVKTGDLNNDNLNDIAVSHWSEPYITVLYQTATDFDIVTYLKPISGFDEIDIGDVNNDGLEDVVFMSGQSEGGIHVFLQNDSGALDPYVSYYLEPGIFQNLNGMAIGDLNNDNENDIVASKGGNTPWSKMVVWLQDTLSGTFTDSFELTAYDIPQPVEISDLNCDGRNEIITAHAGWYSLSVYEQDSQGIYNSYKSFTVPTTNHLNRQGMGIGDINNDGREDIAIADVISGLILLINNSAPATFDQIDSSVTTNHIVADTLFETSFFYEYIVDTIMNYEIVTFNNYDIIKSSRFDIFRTDSVIIRTGMFCDRPYVDTLINSTFVEFTIFLGIDTTLTFTFSDSTLIVSDGYFDPYLEAVKMNPNPTEGIINFDWPESIVDDNIEVIIYNSTGTIVIPKNLIRPKEGHIDLSHLPDGLYFLTLRSGSTLRRHKIIKART